MIVDCHTHHLAGAYAKYGGNLLASMDEYGIDHAAVFTYDGFFEESAVTTTSWPDSSPGTPTG